MRSSASSPSSGPSGHLLPAGEKRAQKAHLALHLFYFRGCNGASGGAARNSFSPAGRRWPEGPDEGDGAMHSEDVTKRRPGKTSQARRLRRDETEEEYRLWSDLRARRLNGFKFSRQIPLGPYVVDFLCREQRLIVEIDGFHHANTPSDAERTLWLNKQGYSVLRFWNPEVTRERRAVLDTILAAVTGQLTERCEIARFFPAPITSNSL
jgi:very-short-patch-repair endonuclease